MRSRDGLLFMPRVRQDHGGVAQREQSVDKHIFEEASQCSIDLMAEDVLSMNGEAPDASIYVLHPHGKTISDCSQSSYVTQTSHEPFPTSPHYHRSISHNTVHESVTRCLPRLWRRVSCQNGLAWAIDAKRLEASGPQVDLQAISVSLSYRG